MKTKFILILSFLLNHFISNAQCNNADFSYTANQVGLVDLRTDTTSSHPNALRHIWYFDMQNHPNDFIEGAPVYFYYRFLHFYDQPGTYFVKHVVIDSISNCRDSVTKNVTANYAVSCHADFDIQSDSFSNKIYTYISDLTYTGSGIKNISWIVDGNIKANYLIALKDTLPEGSHQVCLNIETNSGCTSSSCYTINVAPSQNCQPVSFTATVAPDNHRKFTFTPTPQNASLRYQWQFGDGYSSQQMITQHTYYASTNYEAKLITYDTATNCSDTVNKIIEIVPLPSETCTASFTYNLDSSHAVLTPSSNQPIINQTWYFYKNYYPLTDSLFVTNGQPVQYNFKDTGYYYICLKINTNTGCTISTCQSIIVENLSQPSSGMPILPSYPNPATNNVKVNVDMYDAGLANITVYNSFGTVVYKAEINTIKGKNTITIPIQGLEKGQYFIDILQRGKRNKSIFQKL